MGLKVFPLTLIVMLNLFGCAHALVDPVSNSPSTALSHDHSVWVTTHSERETVALPSYVEQPLELDIDASVCPKKAGNAIEISRVSQTTDSAPTMQPELKLQPEHGEIEFAFRTETTYLPNESFMICPAMKSVPLSPDDCFGSLNIPELKAGRHPTRHIDVKYFGKECAFEAE